MCWVSAEATQKVAEKDFYVYKIGQVLKDGTFVSHYKYFKYVPKTRNKTISLIVQVPCRSVHIIQQGYHSYLTEETAKYVRDIWNTPGEIGIFEVPIGATIYVNYKLREVVSTDIKYLGVLKL